MFIPLHDQNPLRVIPVQVTTLALIACCVGVFAWQLGLDSHALGAFQSEYGLIPAQLLGAGGANVNTDSWSLKLGLLTGMFLHGGWLHLLGNMAYLWVFGDNVEDAMGHARFLLFYLLCGVLAAAGHALLFPQSYAPLIGASGAVAGVMGAYVMLHPRVKVLILAFSRFPIQLPAYVLLALWFAWQIYAAVTASSVAVAWWAHVVGFVVGAILVIPFKRAEVALFDQGTSH
jgi:membrane associated rhomboid family serine protease